MPEAKVGQEKINEGILNTVLEGLNNPIVTMATVLLSSQIIRRVVDMNDAGNVSRFRIVYITSQVIHLLCLLLLRSLIRKGPQGGKVVINHPANPLTGEPAKRETLNDRDYDLQEVGKMINQQVLGFVFMMILHRFFGLVQPLVLQSVLPWKALAISQIVRIRVWGQHATGTLARPFAAAASPFAELLKAGTDAPDASTAPKRAIKKKDDEDDEFDVPPSIDDASDGKEGKNSASSSGKDSAVRNRKN